MIHISQAALEQMIKMFNSRKAAVGLANHAVGALLDQGGMSNIYRIVDRSGNTHYVLRVSEEHKSSYSNDIFNVREMEILRELQLCEEYREFILHEPANGNTSAGASAFLTEENERLRRELEQLRSRAKAKSGKKSEPLIAYKSVQFIVAVAIVLVVEIAGGVLTFAFTNDDTDIAQDNPSSAVEDDTFYQALYEIAMEKSIGSSDHSEKIGDQIEVTDMPGLDVTQEGNHYTFTFGSYPQGSEGEVESYFTSDSDRKTYTTDYIHKKEYDNEDRSDYWWLWSPGDDSGSAARVESNGNVDQHGYNIDFRKVAVRPAFWLNLE